MTSFRFQDRRIPRLGLATMLLLLLLSMLFWRERSWLLDVAFQTFLMIKDGTVQVMVYRFGAATVQSLPLLGIKLGLPLAVVSWLYSVSFHLHFLTFFCACAYGFKREDIALGIALLYTAMTFDGFYWQTSELQQGLGFLLVSWAALLRYPQPKRYWQWGLWGLTVVALAFYHPLVFMPFYFMLVWLWFKPNAGVPRFTISTLGLMMFGVLVVKQIWFQNWYDAQKTEQFLRHFEQYFPHFYAFPAYGKFLTNALLYWWGYSVLWLGISGLLARRKQWWGLTFLWIVTAGFLLLTAIGDPATPHRFYAEVNYYPLLAFVLVPLLLNMRFLKQETSQVLTASKTANLSKWAFPVLALFLLARIALIAWHSGPYTARVNYLRTLNQTYADRSARRIVVPAEALATDTLLMDWGLPYETLLQSATETEYPQTLLPFSVDQQAAKASELSSDTLFVTPWDAFPLRKVNQRGYWTLPEEAYDLPQ
ncbi:MAG: hypothetical protein AAF828_11735 [Bacteroidota bacterium]